MNPVGKIQEINFIFEPPNKIQFQDNNLGILCDMDCITNFSITNEPFRTVQKFEIEFVKRGVTSTEFHQLQMAMSWGQVMCVISKERKDVLEIFLHGNTLKCQFPIRLVELSYDNPSYEVMEVKVRVDVIGNMEVL